VTADLPKATRRLLDSIGHEVDVKVFPEGTKTAEDAAKAVGCEVAAIVKSLVFVVDDEPVLAIVPGDLRLDTSALAAAAGGEKARRATLEEVRSATGFAAGGTPPFGHATPLRVFADPMMRRNDPVWCAAGTPTTVLSISIADLDRLARPLWVSVT
jgi:Cys-tRNA(Pro) deacylase